MLARYTKTIRVRNMVLPYLEIKLNPLFCKARELLSVLLVPVIL